MRNDDDDMVKLLLSQPGLNPDLANMQGRTVFIMQSKVDKTTSSLPEWMGRERSLPGFTKTLRTGSEDFHPSCRLLYLHEYKLWAFFAVEPTLSTSLDEGTQLSQDLLWNTRTFGIGFCTGLASVNVSHAGEMLSCQFVSLLFQRRWHTSVLGQKHDDSCAPRERGHRRLRRKYREEIAYFTGVCTLIVLTNDFYYLPFIFSLSKMHYNLYFSLYYHRCKCISSWKV